MTNPARRSVRPDASEPSTARMPNHSKAAYESLVNTLPLNLLIKDIDGRRLFANLTYLQTRNCTLDEVLGKRDEDLFPADIASAFTRDDHRVIETKESLHSVEKTVDVDGKTRWIERIKSPVLDPDGEVIGVQLIFWDVTDRHLAETELRYERHLLAALLENIPDSIYFKDLGSRFVRISEAMARKFGLPSTSDVIGKSDADIFTDTHAAAAREDELRIMRTGQPVVDLIERETWPDRDDTWCLTTKMPLRDDDDAVIGTFGISRDITELKQYEEDLREARDAADAANKAKGDFLANMSHEIRTPMNAIIGMSELLAQTELDREQLDQINLVRDSAESLLQLLNEILDFSKIESQKLQLESIPFKLRNLVHKINRTLAIRAQQKGVELECTVAPDLPDRWRGDPGRLRQVLINLIGNAIKFTDEGSVSVHLSRGRWEGKPVAGSMPIRFSVKDTGIGIEASKQAVVLAPFTQADASTTRRFGGTGLGLAISRQLIELMDGELELSSVAGDGTEFFFTINLEEATSLADQEAIDANDSGIGTASQEDGFPECASLRVLVAEDGLSNQHVAVGMLRSCGHHAVVVGDGSEAVKRVEHEAFDVVLMDMHMPVMDGIEATRAIRKRETVTGNHVPIIALTAAAMQEDRKACREAGMDGFLTKPIHRRQLQQALIKYAPKTSVLESIDPDESPATSRATESSMDLEAAAARVPGGMRGVRRLAEVFRGECIDLMQVLHQNIPEGDPLLVARSAHTLKGSANLFLATRVHDAARCIEDKAREGDLADAELRS